MKTITKATFGIFLLVFSTQAQQISEQISFSVNDVETSQLNGYDIVRLANASILEGGEYVGKPQLPIAHINILLPKGATATAVTINGQSTQLSGNFNLYPTQPPAYTNFEAPPAFVGQNASIYSSNSEFPQTPVLDYSNHIYREYSFVSIEFIPFFYKPQSGVLKLLTQANITVSYTMGNIAPMETTRSI